MYNSKLLDLLRIINRDSHIILKDNNKVVFDGAVKDSIEVLNNCYNTPNNPWTDKLYVKSFKDSDIENKTEIEIITI